jgi:nucleoside-diphosphate-sugar epimerase
MWIFLWIWIVICTTHMVPWMASGHMRLPLVMGEDMGRSFALAALSKNLNDFESFNIAGSEFPTMRELFNLIAKETGFSTPHYSVSYPAAYAFGWLMENLRHILPGNPFLMRSVVFVCENWLPTMDYARRKIGYIPQKDWKQAVRDQVAEIKKSNYPWPKTKANN